jgi:hypothetical protein
VILVMRTIFLIISILLSGNAYGGNLCVAKMPERNYVWYEVMKVSKPDGSRCFIHSATFVPMIEGVVRSKL